MAKNREIEILGESMLGGSIRICAPKNLTLKEIEKRLNKERGGKHKVVGMKYGKEVMSKNQFIPNILPIPCNDDDSRMHYIVEEL